MSALPLEQRPPIAAELHRGRADLATRVTDGWDIAFLGTDLPHPDIERSIESQPWRFVGISATLLANVPAVIDLVERIRRGPAASVTILAGGPALTAAPELCQELQIGPPVSDVRHAVQTARDLA